MKTLLLIVLLALFSANIVAQTNTVVDADGDGLIDINDLETLNAIRFQLDEGYELMRDLDFNDDDSYSSIANKITWTTGAGWQPIGDSSDAFSGRFNGNGHTISNLMIDRSGTSNIGLFGYTSSGTEITNLGLLNIDIIAFSSYVGGLVGWNESTMTNTYATGSIIGTSSRVGGLVGRNAGTVMSSYATVSVGGTSRAGGLVGRNYGIIVNSYATGSVTGSARVGGLVGRNTNLITSSYATGSVEGTSQIGGLVGRHDIGTITNSYATGLVTGDSNAGGLVGRSDTSTTTDSYWDINTSGIRTSDGGTSKTTVELQSPTTTIGIYLSWSSDNWDFGTSVQYPVLKYTDNPNTDNSECRRVGDTTTDLPVCGSLLSPIARGLSELQLVGGNLSPDFDVIVPSYRGTVVNSINTIQFRPITVNPDAKVYIMVDEEARSPAIDSGDESGMISLNTDGITTITIEVENGGETTQTVRYTLSVNYYEFSGDVDRDDDGLIEIDNLEGLNAIRYQPDGTGYRENETAPKVTVGCPNNGCRGYELTRDLDFNDADSYGSVANRITWTTGAGWQPIGDSSDAFSGRFNGNGYTISGLMISRGESEDVGLFGYTRNNAEIANVGLLNVDIAGDDFVGGLVGGNAGTIMSSYATGSISGNEFVGGLVGGNDEGTITNSYATGSISGDEFVGGLVGGNFGVITNSYATGSVLGSGFFGRAGGLVGGNFGVITNSYATGSVSGFFDVGGLVGDNGGIITSSYWDINTSGIQTSAGGTSKTTVELKAESAQDTDPDKPYYEWSTTNWDFGTSVQYPVLKYADNPNTDSRECRSVSDTTTDLPVCGSLLSPIARGLSELQLVGGNLSPDFDVIVPSYRGTVVNSINTIQFRPITVNPDAKVYIMVNEEARGMAIDSGGESGMISLNLDGITTITIEVENRGQTTQTVRYTLSLNYYEFSGDVDRDDDGLIEIDNLEGLNAIRYQPDGTGYRESETEPKVAVGCPNNGCRGYELTRDLDFNDADSYGSVANRITWTTGAGWQPIGDFSDAFIGRFNGNGYTISGLMISRDGSEDVGLFGYAGNKAAIANVGLLNVDIIGGEDIGGLVGDNEGTITNSYATGSIAGDDDIGGLVGDNEGTLTNSYATGSIAGNEDIGGLVGHNDGGTITNSHATGSISGGDYVGGLVGWSSSSRGTITSSYATGSVSGSSSVGGLVSLNSSIITDSYWNIDTSGIATSDGGTTKTTVELQSPTMATGIYSSWSSDNWDFGTSVQYPVLKYADNPNTDSRECRSISDTTTDLPVCGSLLLPALRYGLRELQLLRGNLSPDFDVVVPSYRGTVVNSISTIQFRPITVNPDAKVYITANEETRGIAIDSGDESGMVSLNTGGITTITIEVENRGQITQTVRYTLSLNYYEFNGDVDRDDNGLIEVDNLEGLNAMRYQPDGTGYRESETAPKIAIGCPNNGCRGYELTRNLDFNNADSYSLAKNRTIWATGAGWQPIGDSVANTFSGKFEGNGYNISHLFISSSDTSVVGLFGYTGNKAAIANVGLLNVDIIGSEDVGSLVGDNGGTIMNSYATGFVSGNGNDVGGLVGLNRGIITNSYATGFVSGNGNDVGGLVGDNEGIITNSYATGSVSGDFGVGGLVGWSSSSSSSGSSRGTITNSYATGSVSGNFRIGGLVGGNFGSITNSYWNIDTSVIQTSAGGTTKTTMELQSPTMAIGIYSSWSRDNWDFGTSIQYPAVKYALGNDIRNPSCDAKLETPLPRCGSLLPDQRARPRGGNITPTIMTTFPLSITLLEGAGTTLNVVVRDTNDDDLVASINSDSRAVATAMIIATDGGTRTLEITGVGEGEATITATVDDGRDTINSIASLVFRVTVEANEAPTLEIISSSMPTIEAGSTANIVVSVRDQNFDMNDTVAVAAMSSNQSVVSVMPAEISDITADTNITFTLTAGQAGEATITFTVTDNGEQGATIRSNPYRVANESPVIESITAPEMIDEGDTRSIRVNASDANEDSLTYAWRVNSRYVGINVSGNPATLSIPDYFITDFASSKTTVELEVTVSDGIASTTGMVSVIVNKRDNGDAILRTSLEIDVDDSSGTTLSTWTASVASEDPDGGTSGTVVYQWQVCEGNEGRCPSESNWMDIGGAIGTPYEILGSSVSVGGEKFPLVEESSLFRVRGTYKDNQGYDEIVNSAGRIYTTRPALMIRVKVFLEGPLQ